MKFGLVGLGRRGGNVARRLCRVGVAIAIDIALYPARSSGPAESSWLFDHNVQAWRNAI